MELKCFRKFFTVESTISPRSTKIKNDQNMGSVDLAWNNLLIYYLVVLRKIMNEVFSFGLLFWPDYLMNLEVGLESYPITKEWKECISRRSWYQGENTLQIIQKHNLANIVSYEYCTQNEYTVFHGISLFFIGLPSEYINAPSVYITP